LVVVEKATKEVASRETESPLEERAEHQDLFSIGCRDVLPFGRLPLKHHAVREEMILD
jgi:hypothetical protein